MVHRAQKWKLNEINEIKMKLELLPVLWKKRTYMWSYSHRVHWKGRLSWRCLSDCLYSDIWAFCANGVWILSDRKSEGMVDRTVPALAKVLTFWGCLWASLCPQAVPGTPEGSLGYFCLPVIRASGLVWLQHSSLLARCSKPGSMNAGKPLEWREGFKWEASEARKVQN